MYTFGEAARLADVSSTTVRNWLFGYTKKDMTVTPQGYRRQARQVKPLFNTMPSAGAMVSFLQLAEIVVAGKFRKAEGVSFQTVKQAYENAQKEFDLTYPFAHLRLRAIGGHIVELLHGQSLQAIDTPSLYTLPGLVEDVIEQFEYEDDLAARWFPQGKEIPIVVDPRISAGVPTFQGRGVTIATLYWRWKEPNQTIDFIANDFNLPRDKVERALKYAEKVAA